MTTLEVTQLRGGYASAEEIVKGIDLTIRARELAVIIGPNGAGKSTFLKLVAGLLYQTAGVIALGGTTLKPGDAGYACEHGLAFVPQEKNVFASLTVKENLEMGGFLAGKELRSRLATQLERFPILKPRLKDRAGNLSGGQRQVLAIAIALMSDPKVLLLDEPTAGLSPAAADSVFTIITELAQHGLTILMVEQNALIALEYGTRGIVFVAGTKMRDEAAPDLLADEEMRHLFLGGAAVPN